jgi:hypothetical protein
VRVHDCMWDLSWCQLEFLYFRCAAGAPTPHPPPAPRCPRFPSPLAACANYTVGPYEFASLGGASPSYLYIPAASISAGVPLIVGVTTRNSNLPSNYFLRVVTSDFSTLLSAGYPVQGQVRGRLSGGATGNVV